jgi:transcriptional regulator with XRE-family HTH domain
VISEVLKKRKLQIGKKPSEIAEKIGVSESTYRDWENGRKIQGEPYRKIAEALEISIIDLLEIERVSYNYLKSELENIDNSIKNIRKIVI